MDPSQSIDGLGLTFGQLSADGKQAAQFAISQKILAEVKRQEFTQAELEELYVAATSTVTANDSLQNRLREAIKNTGSPS